MIKTKDEIIANAKPIEFSKQPGIYYLLENEEIIYIGKTINISKRIGNHLASTRKKFDSYYIYLCPLDDLSRFEKEEVAKYRPKYNVEPRKDGYRCGDKVRASMLQFIKQYWDTYGFSPSVRDIQSALHISSTGVVKFHLDTLKRKGMIETTPGTARSIIIIEV